MLDDMHGPQQIGLARAGRAAALVDAAYRAGRTQDHGAARDRLSIRRVADTNAGHIGERPVQSWIFGH
jgi:hypothetical protein